MKLKNKIAVITGSSRGIGKAIAAVFAKEGAKVVVCYKTNRNKAEEVAKDIRSKKGEAIAVELDVTQRRSIKNALAKIENKYKNIDILVNNAGINKPNDFDKISDEDWDEVIGVNLTGMFKVTQEFLPIIKNKGSIINISSVSGQYGGPRTTHYAVSKAGVISLTQNLAIFCAKRNIRVNVISPGLIASEMAEAAKGLKVADKILLKRLGLPEEVAKAAVFLASDGALYITAQGINVNGGLYF